MDGVCSSGDSGDDCGGGDIDAGGGAGDPDADGGGDSIEEDDGAIEATSPQTAAGLVATSA